MTFRALQKCVTALLVFVFFAHASSAEESPKKALPWVERSALQAEQRLKKSMFWQKGALMPLIEKMRRKRCTPSICFMLTGSRALSPAALQVQRDFVFTAAGLLSIANPRLSLSAVQYAYLSNEISKPTLNAQEFQTRVLNRKHFWRAPYVRLAPAMLSCLSHFAGQDRAPRKLVILADARAPRVRESGPLRPTRISRFLRSAPGADVCAVNVGNAGRNRLRSLVRSDRNILQANAWGVLQLRKLLEPLIDSVCGGPPANSPEWRLFDQ